MYETMKALIEDDKLRLKNGSLSQEEYNMYKARNMKRLAVYKGSGRLTQGQYDDLLALYEEE